MLVLLVKIKLFKIWEMIYVFLPIKIKPFHLEAHLHLNIFSSLKQNKVKQRIINKTQKSKVVCIITEQ